MIVIRLLKQTEMTKEKIKVEDIHPLTQVAVMSVLQILALSVMGLSMFFISVLSADQMVHKFKNPSFSGSNTSSHYLTIENQEFNRKEAIKAEIEAYQDELAREAKNTTLARFIRNLESRIYAQLSRQLVENLFGENPSDSGQVELEGNIIEYESDGEYITLKITDAEGNETIITLPIGSFTF